MELTILYDNTVYNPALQPAWGFSCIVHHGEETILFDTGAHAGTLLANMEKLDCEPSSVNRVVISHPHFDHIGGLPGFLSVRPDVDLCLPDTSLAFHPSGATFLREPQELAPKVYTTGVLKSIEQSLVVATSEGLTVISGCAHPGVETILHAASRFGPVKALIGGLHGFDKLELINDLDWICPTHCTMRTSLIKEAFPKKYIQGGAGRRIHIE